MPEPSYVSYAPCVTLAGGTPVAVKCSAENEFILTPECIEKAVTPKTKAIIVAYPFAAHILDRRKPVGKPLFQSAKRGALADMRGAKLLAEQKVAVVPGSAFGEAGKYHVRCSYATSMQQLTTAIDRITSFIEGR